MTSTKPPTLAIVIPVYGHPSLLIDAIESALCQQTSCEYRIVLVNDGCPSSQTEQVCRQYAQTHPCAHPLCEKAQRRPEFLARIVASRSSSMPGQACGQSICSMLITACTRTCCFQMRLRLASGKS